MTDKTDKLVAAEDAWAGDALARLAEQLGCDVAVGHGANYRAIRDHIVTLQAELRKASEEARQAQALRAMVIRLCGCIEYPTPEANALAAAKEARALTTPPATADHQGVNAEASDSTELERLREKVEGYRAMRDVAREKRRDAERQAQALRERVQAWDSWYADLRADFSGVTDDFHDYTRGHSWDWIDDHRPAPEALAAEAEQQDAQPCYRCDACGRKLRQGMAVCDGCGKAQQGEGGNDA